MSAYDLGAVARAAAGRRLRLPRRPHRGKAGDVRAASAGSALELHDFRPYQPGDDLRHVDWNAAARLGELVVRVREDEVSPRVEVVLDATASMAVTPVKEARAQEIAAWALALAAQSGFEPVLVTVGREARRVPGPRAPSSLLDVALDGHESFERSLERAVLRPCGLRVVVSDFLVDASPPAVAARMNRGAAGLALVQVLDREDLSPGPGGARLVDSETGGVLDRLVTAELVERYTARLEAHVAQWSSAARRVHATWVSLCAESGLDALVADPLAFLVDADGGGA